MKNKVCVILLVCVMSMAAWAGTIATPYVAGDFQCKTPIFGRSNNPWDETRTTGGSTGGGAAALAFVLWRVVRRRRAPEEVAA